MQLVDLSRRDALGQLTGGNAVGKLLQLPQRRTDRAFQIVGCPIVREEDGLAKSSRNTYLSCEERKAALCLSKAVKKGQELIRNGIAASDVLEPMCEIINSEPLARIDYVSMVDALSMQPVDSVNADVLVAMAVYIGKTRLIDNFSYEV